MPLLCKMNDNKKRPAESKEERADKDGSNGETKSKKRTRFQQDAGAPIDATNFLPTAVSVGGHRFLRLHLQLLKALYFEKKDCSDDSANGKAADALSNEKDDGPIDNELCRSIERFLRDRGRLRGLDADVAHYERLYESAMDFMEEEGQDDVKQGSHMTISPWNMLRLSPAANASGGLARGGDHHHHPFYGSSTSFLFGNSQQSPFMTMLSNRKYPHGLLSSSQDADTANTASNAFGVVVGMLQAKYGHAVKTLQQTSHPFGPLISQVTKRVEMLEQLLDTTTTTKTTTTGSPRKTTKRGDEEATHLSGKKEEAGAGQSLSLQQRHLEYLQRKTEEEDNEWRARIETKLRLWKLLHSDLIE